MKEEKLDNKTPNWFKQWHIEHFKPVRDRTSRNEKWIYLILIAIIGSGVLANGGGRELASFLQVILRG